MGGTRRASSWAIFAVFVPWCPCAPVRVLTVGTVVHIAVIVVSCIGVRVFVVMEVRLVDIASLPRRLLTQQLRRTAREGWRAARWATFADLCRVLHGTRCPEHLISRAGPFVGHRWGVGRAAALFAWKSALQRHSDYMVGFESRAEVSEAACLGIIMTVENA